MHRVLRKQFWDRQDGFDPKVPINTSEHNSQMNSEEELDGKPVSYLRILSIGNGITWPSIAGLHTKKLILQPWQEFNG